MGSNSARSTAALGVIGGFELEVGGSVIRSYYGERTTIDRDDYTITQYGSVVRAFFAKGSNGLDQNGRAIDFPTYIPDTGFDLDKPDTTIPELVNLADTNIIQDALTNGGHRLFIDQKGKPGYLKNMVHTEDDLAAKTGPLVNNLEGVRALINDALVDQLGGIGNPFSDLADFAVTDSGADGSMTISDGVADLQPGSTNTGSNDGLGKTSVAVVNSAENLFVCEMYRSDGNNGYGWIFSTNPTLEIFRGTSVSGPDVATATWKEWKDFVANTSTTKAFYFRPTGTFAVPAGFFIRNARSYDLTINQRAA